MGVRGLYHYCKGFLKPPDFKNYIIGIDVSSLLYRFHGDFDAIYTFLTPLLKNKLLFVFDGKAPKYKERELQIRKAAKDISENRIQMLKDSLTNLTNQETIIIIKKRIHDLELENYSPTYEVKQNFKKFLYSKNLTYVKSSGEADSLLIDLYYHNYIDAVLSNDMDYLVAGVNVLYVPVKNVLKQVTLSYILDHEELNLEQFKEVALLMGIDNNRIFVVDDFGIAASFIRHYGCISIMKEKMNHLFSDIIDISEVKKRYAYTKNIMTYLKAEHKDRLELWNMNLHTNL
jgi:5'-3' exonuclease